MTALPADVAKYTRDGLVVTSQNLALKAAHREALDLGSEEIEMFYDSAADAQAMLDEKLALRSKINPLHEGVEVEETLAIGVSIPISPVVPNFRYIDEAREIDKVARTRAFAYETGSDRYSVELLE